MLFLRGRQNVVRFIYVYRHHKSSKKRGPTGIRTQVVGFKVQSANHYTIEPLDIIHLLHINMYNK